MARGFVRGSGSWDGGQLSITNASKSRIEVYLHTGASFGRDKRSRSDRAHQPSQGFCNYLSGPYAAGGVPGMLEPMFNKIERIRIEGLFRPESFGDRPWTEEKVETVFGNMPAGFKKDYRYGLGPKFEYRAVAEAVEQLSDCTEISISESSQTRIDPHSSTLFHQ